jgi:hypothetical protein
MHLAEAGVEKNDEVAVSFAKQGAEAGDATGMLLYAVMFIEVRSSWGCRSRQPTARRLLVASDAAIPNPARLLSLTRRVDVARGRRAACCGCG